MRRGSRAVVLALSLAASLYLAPSGFAEEAKQAAEQPKLEKSGTLTLTEYEAGIGISDVVWGHGEVTAFGKTRKFRLNGMGAGAGGGAKISATGTVYNLKEIGLFAGVYSEASIGAVAGKEGATTATWLRNTNGVILELHGKTTGLAVTGGANGVLIQFED